MGQSEGRTKNFPRGCLRASAPVWDGKEKEDARRLGKSRLGQNCPRAQTWAQGRRRLAGKMLSCSHFSTYDGPGPRLGAFVRINFYLISFQLALPLPLQEIRSLSPCFRKSTGDGYRVGRSPTAGGLQISLQPLRKAFRSPFLTGDATAQARGCRVLDRS